MTDTELMKIVVDVAEFLTDWRCDRRESRPKLLGPGGTSVVVRVEQGNTIRFISNAPRDLENRYRSWQGWGITRDQWHLQAISCSATRSPKQIAKDIDRRLLSNVVKFWPIAMASKQHEQEQAAQLELVSALMMRMIPSANYSAWQSNKHRKVVYFDGGECDLNHYCEDYPAKLIFRRLSYDDALKMALYYQQLMTEMGNQDGQAKQSN